MSKRLDFSSVPLAGRSSELQTLQEAFKSAAEALPVVYIEAPSGTGKSFLVETWHREHQPESLFVSGKFNQLQQSPYAAIVQAIVQVCNHFDEEALQKAVKQQMASEQTQVLADLMPNIFEVTRSSDDGSASGASFLSFDGELSNASSENFATVKATFNLAIRRLLKLLCGTMQKNEPFVIHIDDLQWADKNSLELLLTIIADYELHGFMLILTTRPATEDVSPFILKLEESERSDTLSRITLEDLSAADVNQILSTLMELSVSMTEPLAEIVHEKTKGNSYFVLQYLHSLHHQELIHYSMVEYRWFWDNDEIRDQTDLADNVAELVLERVEALDRETRSTLQLASYLGATFELDFLAYLSRELKEELLPLNQRIEVNDDEIAQGQQLEPLMKLAVEAHLVTSLQEGLYRFTHDSIQESFLNANRDRAFLYRIGILMLRLYRSTRGKAWMLFAAVHALNEAGSYVTNDTERVELIRLNIKAAEKAVSRAAFFPASQYQ